MQTGSRGDAIEVVPSCLLLSTPTPCHALRASSIGPDAPERARLIVYLQKSGGLVGMQLRKLACPAIRCHSKISSLGHIRIIYRSNCQRLSSPA